MFQNLRAGTPIYVLYKNEPQLHIGKVVSVSNVRPQFGNTFQMGMKNVVDIDIEVGDKSYLYTEIQADVAITDYSKDRNIVIAEDKNAILNEIEVLRKRSECVLESVEYHKKMIQDCSKMIEELNPAIKQEAEQRKEIDSLKQNVAKVDSKLSNIEDMLARFLKRDDDNYRRKEK